MDYTQLNNFYEGNFVFRQMVDLFESYLRGNVFTPGVLKDAVDLACHRLKIVEPA